MPMYTAASPGNLLPKFSAPADGGTIARRASLLQSRTGAADKDAPVGVLPTREVVVAGAAAAYAAAPTRTTRTAKANLDFIVAPFPTRSPRRREAARVAPAAQSARRRGSTRLRTRRSRSRPREREWIPRSRRAFLRASSPRRPSAPVARAPGAHLRRRVRGTSRRGSSAPDRP